MRTQQENKEDNQDNMKEVCERRRDEENDERAGG